jgi:two-component system alkaline phosphatase synthesis response regulator PhoP
MGHARDNSKSDDEKKTVIAVMRERALGRALFTELESAGYGVAAVRDATAAQELVRHQKPDVVLVDLELAADAADSTGFSSSDERSAERKPRVSKCLAAWRRLRGVCDAPVLVFAADLHQAEWFVDQEAGADDFVLTASGPNEVLARIQVLLRWAESRRADVPQVISVDDLVLRPAFHQVTLAGQPVDMTRTELALLAMMASEPGRVFSRSELMGVLRGKRNVSERTIDSHINNLRSKIESDPHCPRRVLTVFGVGYKYNGAVKE